MQFNHNSKGLRLIPRQRRLVTIWRGSDAARRNRMSLAIWFSKEAIDAWRTRFRMTPADQPRHSSFAIESTPALQEVSRLTLRQTEVLIGSIMQLLQNDLFFSDRSTLSHQAYGPPVQGRPCSRTGELNSIVDSTGLKPCVARDQMFEKRGTSKRRFWQRELRLGVDTDSDRIAFDLADSRHDDASQVEPSREQLDHGPASFNAAFDRSHVLDADPSQNKIAKTIVPLSKGAVQGSTATAARVRRNLHIQSISQRGQANWRKTSSYNPRSKGETSNSRDTRVIGNALHSPEDARRWREFKIIVNASNARLELGRPVCERLTLLRSSGGLRQLVSMQTRVRL